MTTKKKMLGAAAGTAAAGGAGLDITDVFSTYLYEGTGSALTINNGIDLSGEGGLVWTKGRGVATSHFFIDTERGATQTLYFPSTAVAGVIQSVTAFNSNGFSVGTDGNVNSNGNDFSSWTFRKAPKFFDIVTYTGNSVAGRTVSHNLGSVPGMMIVKTTAGLSGGFSVYHRSNTAAPATERLFLNQNLATADNSNYWNDTAPTSTEFTLGASGDTNHNGKTYVAYLFAHNDGDGEFGPDGDQDIIKCGGYTGNGGATGPVIDLGFEPQFLMFKRATGGTANWMMVDCMRGLNVSGRTELVPNLSNAEYNNTTSTIVEPTSTGFKLTANASQTNSPSSDYIYMAIRRGPLAPPEAATEVFAPNFYGTSGYVGYLGAPADMHMLGYRSGNSQNAVIRTRMLSNTKGLVTSSNAAEVTTSSSWDNMSGVSTASSTITTLISWTWKRAPSFFDVVAYTGNGTAAQTIGHNLGVAPEMMWVKSRSLANDWVVYHSGVAVDAETDYLKLNTTSAKADWVGAWNDTAPTSSSFTVGSTPNTNSATYIAYLFATLAGVSKVGSFSHTYGGTTNVDCGFTSGARFVLWKRTDGTRHWEVFDTTRGIVAGNDAYLRLSQTAAETAGDYIDPYSAGFSIGAGLGTGEFIFYAIA